MARLEGYVSDGEITANDDANFPVPVFHGHLPDHAVSGGMAREVYATADSSLYSKYWFLSRYAYELLTNYRVSKSRRKTPWVTFRFFDNGVIVFVLHGIFSSFTAAFLVLLFIETNHDRDPRYRGPPRSGLEWAILIYVIGYCWDLCKKLQMQGFSTFIHSWWNIYDIINMSLFFSTFAVWYWASVHAKGSPELNRMQWEWNEPTLISEGLFGFSTILSFGKLLQIFRVGKHCEASDVDFSLIKPNRQ